MKKLAIALIFLLTLTACNHIQPIKTSLWHINGGSVTINNSAPIFTGERLFFAERNKKVCVIYSSFFGNLWVGSTLYKGAISRGVALVHTHKDLYGSGERASKYVEPIEILMAGDSLAIRFEIPADSTNGRLQLLKKIDPSKLESNNENNFQSNAPATLLINEKFECESAI